MRLTRAAAGAASLLLAAGLAACSGDPEPGSPMPTGDPVPSATSAPTTPAPSAAPSPSESPVTAPTLPPEATTNDAAGAEAFVRYWFDAVNYAYDTLDPAPLEDVSDEACTVCASIAEEIEDLAAGGEPVSGGSYQLDEVSAPAPDPTGVNIVSLTYTREAPSVQNGESTAPAATPVSVAAVIEWRDDEWSMYDFGQ